MKSPIRSLVLLAAVAVSALAAASPAQAAEGEDGGGGAAFVQTNDPAGNSIDAYRRNADGVLTFSATYPTGGLGGREAGAGSDPLASQGSLRLIAARRLLIAVNAGSNTITVFHASGAQLEREQVLASGGLFPTGIAVHGNLVYILNAGGAGTVAGFRIAGGGLQPIAGSARTLGLSNANPPFFLSSPAQVGFTPDGEHLIVTTKTNSTIDVFSVGQGGELSASPVKNPGAPVPFAWTFNQEGLLVLSFAGSSSLQTFTVNENNTISAVSAPVSDTQAALCWVTAAAGYEYVSNTGSGDVSQFRVSAEGGVTLVNPVAASGILGATDSSAVGHFLYVQSGLGGKVYAYSIGGGGALSLVQAVTVPDGASQEGIAVS